MTKLRLLIVDDEPLIRAGLRSGLSTRDDVVVVGECESVSDAVAALRSDDADVVLLDVEMSDGTGFDVIRMVGPENMPVVVFVTAYDRYAVQAFEVNAVDYLLKPFDQSRLFAAIDRVKKKFDEPVHALAKGLETLLQTREPQWAQTLVVRGEDRFDFVSVSAVEWIESANNYAVLHCGPKSHLLSESLTALEAKLDPTKFLRVHRSIIVNSRRIATVHTVLGGGYEIELQGGSRIKTGRQYRDKIRRLLEN
ncbi:MAG: LytTR family DNA-binding domain-containing protein [Paludibaculum sp.]